MQSQVASAVGVWLILRPEEEEKSQDTALYPTPWVIKMVIKSHELVRETRATSWTCGSPTVIGS